MIIKTKKNKKEKIDDHKQLLYIEYFYKCVKKKKIKEILATK